MEQPKTQFNIVKNPIIKIENALIIEAGGKYKPNRSITDKFAVYGS